MMTEIKLKLRYLRADRSRHGKPRFYVRLPGKRLIRLQVEGMDDPNFAIAYSAALEGKPWSRPGPPAPVEPKSTATATKALPGTLRAICEAYFVFLHNEPQLSPTTKHARRLHLEEVCREPTKPGAPYLMGDAPVSKFGSAHVLAILDRKQATPEAANARRKALAALFKWAVPRRLAESNPVAAVPRNKTYSDGHRTWSEKDIASFTEHHPIGTKAHLAMALLLYTGQRRGDTITFGRQHIKDGVLYFVQQKNQTRSHKKMAIPIIPALAQVLETVPRDQMTFLVTEYGKPFTAAGFGNWFRDRCNEAGLKGLSAHGLRKALQTMGAEAGASDRELMAMAGHEDTRMTSLYTRNRDRAMLAKSGFDKVSAARFENKIGSPFKEVPEGEPIKATKGNEINGH